ncbi:hypothetical protein IP98_02282 [Flavobacterium cauense R2A-7]|uniref:Tetratricopeptide repeat protein n=1 Tax=Flavobacterium cauense R2A-7 TaxID=1341154 RepID=A0A562LSF7_9FLAO|nr:hypothetical protein [Flavobacterium cauense]KGO80158.1 hypothetical protein Q762_12650 [Flavobacterium cauense R2A-7]TWI10468.1 hypothetical protein IP98_02282 [Flavobacterium cauense R2A-7]
MKKLLLFVALFLFASTNLFANEYLQNYEMALKYKKEADYPNAIKYLLKALKEKEEDLEVAQNLCFEISECFRSKGDEKSALKFINAAVRNYGATLEDIAASTILNKDFLRTADASIDADFYDLHRIYLLKSKKIERKEYAKLMQ